MLWLKAVQFSGEFVKCALSGQILSYGMMYYYDDENEKCYGIGQYYNIKRQQRQSDFDNKPLYVIAKSRWDQANFARQAERDYLSNIVLTKPISGKDNN